MALLAFGHSRVVGNDHRDFHQHEVVKRFAFQQQARSAARASETKRRHQARHSSFVQNRLDRHHCGRGARFAHALKEFAKINLLLENTRAFSIRVWARSQDYGSRFPRANIPVLPIIDNPILAEPIPPKEGLPLFISGRIHKRNHNRFFEIVDCPRVRLAAVGAIAKDAMRFGATHAPGRGQVDHLNAVRAPL